MNIKSIKEFWEFADNWYQRTHRLREVWQNPNETEDRREKALRLWYIMYIRVMRIKAIVSDIAFRYYDKEHGCFVIPDKLSDNTVVGFFDTVKGEKIQTKNGDIINL